MIELTLKEKLNVAESDARKVTAEKHFYDAAQPFFSLGFSVDYRNPGHWDVMARRCPGKASAWKAVNPGGFTSDTDDTRERAFRIRGEPGEVIVFDERWNPHRRDRKPMEFRSVSAAMLWVCEELMQEPKS